MKISAMGAALAFALALGGCSTAGQSMGGMANGMMGQNGCPGADQNMDRMHDSMMGQNGANTGQGATAPPPQPQ